MWCGFIFSRQRLNWEWPLSFSWTKGSYRVPSFLLGAPRDDMTPASTTPTGLTPGTSATVAEDFSPPSGGVSQADATPHLTTAPSGTPEPLTLLSTLKPVPSQESKALGSHSTATAMVISTTPAGDSSVSQHCEWTVNSKSFFYSSSTPPVWLIL